MSYNELQMARRGVFNKPRNVAIYLLRNIRCDNLNDINSIFKINAYSTVSSIIQKVTKLKISDRRLQQQIETINKNVSKSQM